MPEQLCRKSLLSGFSPAVIQQAVHAAYRDGQASGLFTPLHNF
jgi:hypothetical protein